MNQRVTPASGQARLSLRTVFAAVLAVAGLAAVCTGTAQNVDKPRRLTVAGSDANGSTIAQTGQNADRLRDNLKRVKLPPGFRIDLYAVVPDARSIAVAPSTDLMFVGTRKSNVWAVTGRGSGGNSGNGGNGGDSGDSGKGGKDGKDGKDGNRSGGDGAAEVTAFAPSLNFRNPNAVCWARDGTLVVVETNRVYAFPAAESLHDGAGVTATEVVPEGRLIPVAEESFGHGARVCRIGPDDKLYIALGQPFNVQPRAKLALYSQWGIGGVVRMNRDGSGREVYASGIRNSVGLDFNPKDKTLWFTDNQTDGMGDDIPMGEINRATAPGQFFGYPYIVSKTRITQYGYDRDPLPANAVDPQVMTIAHAADLGLAFYTAHQFPAKYQGGFFSAQHGSWNRTVPVGAQLLFTSLKPDGTADKTEVFAEGWLDHEHGTYRGRPVDVAVGRDGSLFVSDDLGGAVYRISYVGP